MKKFKLSFLFFLLFISISFLHSKEDKWLKSVKPIITKQELKIYKKLKTEEEKEKFREYFWKARDPKPETPINEYKIEYFKRVEFAEKKLKGINSDRGRVYIYLGPPLERKKYSGYEKIVPCELWIYKNNDLKNGLPPFMNILFYKPGDTGDFRLFYPGIQTPYDLLTPSYIKNVKTKYRAFQLIKMDFPELAEASLSVIPMEGMPLMNIPNSSSGRVLAKVFSIPENTVNKSYLSLFSPESGIVEVETSLKEIYGKFFYSKNEKAGFNFISYSIKPDRVYMEQKGENEFFAKLKIIARLENIKRKLLFEKTNEIKLKLNKKKKDKIKKNGILFSDFIPAIPEDLVLKVFFYNETSKEYMSKSVLIRKNDPVFCLGVKLITNNNGLFPFQFENIKLIVNPDMIYAKNDKLFGIIKSQKKPQVFLINKEKNISNKIENVEPTSNFYTFSYPLSELPDGAYFIKIKGEKLFKSNKFALIPFKKSSNPIHLEKRDREFEVFKYLAALGEEHLNNGNIEKSISLLREIPLKIRGKGINELLAKAYFLKGEYSEVVKIFTQKSSLNYFSLALLANSYLKLNKLKKAAYYFEQMRKYGDTPDVNNKLAAIYFTMGETKKAKNYWKRAKKLSQKALNKKRKEEEK